jgi:hypothetical protein
MNSTIIRIGKYEFTPPLIQCILTERGTFFNLTSTMLNENNYLDFSFGTDLGKWSGDVDNIRLGVKANNLFSLGTIDFSPFIYANSKRSSIKYNGGLIGLGISWKINKNFSLDTEVLLSDNDILAKTRDENGFVIKSGISYRF